MAVIILKSKKIFYGWYIAFACALITGAGIGFHTGSNSIFLKPVCNALGFSRSEFTLYRTIVTLTGTAFLPLYAKLIRRFNIKRVMLTGAAICSLSLIGYSFCTQLWNFYLVAVLNGLFVNSTHFMLVGILVSNWFEDKRGVAIGIAFSGSGLGAAVMIPIASKVIEQTGWRWGYRFMGVSALAILLPIILLVLKNDPESMGLSPYKEKTEDQQSAPPAASPVRRGLYLRQALKTSAFWLLALALFGMALQASAPSTHTGPYLSDLGYPTAIVSAVVSLSMFVLAGGKILTGYIFDRFGALAGSVFLGVFCTLSPAFALLAANPAAPWAHALCLGLASTGYSVPANIYALTYFGEKDYPAIISIFSMVTTFGASIAAPVMGLSYDYSGSYTIAWFALLAFGLLITACLVGVAATAKQFIKPQ